MKKFTCRTGGSTRLICSVDNVQTPTTGTEAQNQVQKYGPEAAENIKKALAKFLTSKGNRVPRNLVSTAINNNEQSFLKLLKSDEHWKVVFHDKFHGHHVNDKIWNITSDDSTGGFNRALECYNGNATDNIKVDDGKLTITAKAQWYVQPRGCKNACVAETDYDPQRVARPYTSGALNTLGKVTIDWSKPGLIEMKFRSSGGHGLQPTLWMYSTNGPTSPGPYGDWSGSGELDIMEIFHGPQGQQTSFGSPFNTPQPAIWFGGSYPNNALLLANPSFPNDPAGTNWHTVQFSWDAKGLFVWKFDGVVSFIVGPSNYQVRSTADESSPLVINPYGSYISITGDGTIAGQDYQGVYVGYDNGGSMVTTAPSPAPFDGTNPYYLMLELQVGGDAYTTFAPDNGMIINAGDSTDLSSVSDGVLSNYQAQQLGLPQRPQGYFTDDQTMEVEYVKYLVGKFR